MNIKQIITVASIFLITNGANYSASAKELVNEAQEVIQTESESIFSNLQKSFTSLSITKKVVTVKPSMTYYQSFTRTGFQEYIYQTNWSSIPKYSGFISDYSGDTFKVLTNFFIINNKLYHSDPKTGQSSTGFQVIDGKKYYFNNNLSDPYAYLGWATIDGDRYYFGTEFYAVTGFNIIDGKKYFFDEDGKLQSGLQVIDGDSYYFDSQTGKQITGWFSISSNYRFYFDPLNGGAAHKGWYYNDKAGVMHFDDSGVMSIGVTKVNDDHYLFTTNGSGKNTYKTTGWYSDKNGKRYYFNPSNDGKAIKGWYYGDSAGAMYFDSQGVMAKGVTKIGDDYYLFTTNGSGKNTYLDTGWFTDSSTGNRYYFDAYDGGKAAKGTKVINGKTYIFSNEGVLQS